MTDALLITTITREELVKIIQESVKMVSHHTDNTSTKHFPELMTRKEAADYLGVSLASIGNYVAQYKILKVYKLGKSARYKKSELDDLFKHFERGESVRSLTLKSSK